MTPDTKHDPLWQKKANSAKSREMNLCDLLSLHRAGVCGDAMNSYLERSAFTPCSMTKAMTLSGHNCCINTCSFNPYGEYELTGSDDGSVWFWDIGSRDPIPKVMLRPHVTNVFTTNFLTGNRFISGGNDATVQFIEIGEGRATATRYENHHIRKVLCSFVIDENTFATCSHDMTVRLFDIRTKYNNQTIVDLPFLNMNDPEYNGEERLSEDLDAHRLRPQNHGGGLLNTQGITVDQNSLLLDLSNYPDAELFTMDIHPIDRKRFITSGSDGTVRMFDLRMIRQKKPQCMGFSFTEHYRRKLNVTGAAFDATGERIAASLLDGNIHVLDTASSIDLTTIPQNVGQRRRSIDFSMLIDPETNTLDFSRIHNLIHHEDIHEEEEEEAEVAPIPGEIIELKDGHVSCTTIKAVNWFGDYVVTGSDDGSVCFYDVETGKPQQILTGHQGNVNVVAVHREKELLSTSGIDSYANLWEPTQIGKCDLEEIRESVNQLLEQNRASALNDRDDTIICSIF